MRTLFSICLAALMAIAIPAQAQQKPEGKKKAKTDHAFNVGKNVNIFNALFTSLDLLYVDTLDTDELLKAAVDGMMDMLDPYTEYYPAEDMSDLEMLTTGKYGGIGSLIRMRKDSTVIIGEPYADMPAAEVGLKVGDVLLNIDGTDLKGKNTSEVSDMLRGEPGTTFVLTVRRPGEKKTRDFHITRRKIHLPAIPYYGMLTEMPGGEQTGYIDLTQFTENCSADVRKAVIRLKEQGAHSLVLDLRGNGGGLLAEAVNIVGLFVPKGTKVVETRGKVKAAEMTYTTQSQPLDLEMPIYVLVNGQTASAAEIVSGALQDLDRATVVGVRTFGKGIVQSPRELPYDGSLKLTTSKYFLPSGRCIQAVDFKSIRENGGDGRTPDSLATVFHTAQGRPVLDGCGIIPDIEVKHDTMANVVYYLSSDDVLVDWGTRYAQAHATLPPIERFSVTDADFTQFKQMCHESGFKYDRISERRLAELKKSMQFEGYYDEATPEFEALERKLEHNLDRHSEDIRRLMEAEVIKRYYYQAGTVQISLRGDKDIEAALKGK